MTELVIYVRCSIVMVSCSGGGRSDLTLIPARKNVNFKPRNMVVVMMEGELSVDVKSLRGNIKGLKLCTCPK